MEIGSAILGWLFGLLSPAIVETIRRQRDLKPMRESVSAELHEFRYTVAITASALRSHLKTGDREFNQWFKKAVDSYQGVEQNDLFRQITEAIAGLDDAASQALNASGKSAGLGLNVKVLRLPALEARVPMLWMFPSRSQSELLLLLARVSHYNQEVETARYYRELTFQLEGINHAVARQNLAKTYEHLGGIAQRIADQAGRCESGLKTGKWPSEEVGGASKALSEQAREAFRSSQDQTIRDEPRGGRGQEALRRFGGLAIFDWVTRLGNPENVEAGKPLI